MKIYALKNDSLDCFQMAVRILQASWNFLDSPVSEVVHAEVEVSQLNGLPLCSLHAPAVELRDWTQDLRQIETTHASDSTSWNTEGEIRENVIDQ